MNITRDGLIVGLVIGIVICGGIGIYPLYSKISALESQLEELEEQLNDQQDLTEFQQEVLYYQIHGVVQDYAYWAFNGTIGHPIDSLLHSPELWHPNYTVSLIQLTKTELREEIIEYLYKYGRRGSVTINFASETVYVTRWGPWETDHRDVRVLWWSPREEG